MWHHVFVHPPVGTLIVAVDSVIFDLDMFLLTFQQSLQMCMCVYVDLSLWMSLNEVKCIHGFAEFELAITDGEESSKFQTHETPWLHLT